jgi:hypothetical protein
MEPIIDHIEITVKDMSVAVPFYDKLLPLLGFDHFCGLWQRGVRIRPSLRLM